VLNLQTLRPTERTTELPRTSVSAPCSPASSTLHFHGSHRCNPIVELRLREFSANAPMKTACPS
jgi:hypothetical protein